MNNLEGAILISGKSYKYFLIAGKKKLKHGLNGGKIKKLIISHNETILAQYNEKWVIKPEIKEAQMALYILMLENN